MWNQQLQSLDSERPKENSDTDEDSSKMTVSKRSSGNERYHH